MCSSKREELIRYGFIMGDHLDENTIAYVFHDSENKLLLAISPSIQIHAEVIKRHRFGWCSSQGILIAFTKKEFDKIINHNYDVRNQLSEPINIGNVPVSFVLKYSYFDRLHKAVDLISPTIIKRVLPCSPCNFTTIDDKEALLENKIHFPQQQCQARENLKLDNFQLAALKAILKYQPDKAPILVAGSFGSGKTRLLARAAYHILWDKNTRVLICAHNNSTVEAFVKNFFKFFELKQRAIRLISPSSNYEPPPDCRKYYATVRNFAQVQEARLVATTFSTALHMHSDHHFKFTHVLMDEGAQTREPESIIPLCLADANTKIVIVGDHKQVKISLKFKNHYFSL